MVSVLTLAQAKTHLNLSVATTNDVELQTFIDAAEAAIAKKCGPLTSVAKTDRVRGCGTGLVLRHTPVVSLTTVTPVGGTAIDSTLTQVDLSAGVVEWVSGAAWSPGQYDVVYQAGRSAALPADLLLGVKELVRHLWTTQRGGGATRPGSSQSDNVAPGSAHALPYRVTELINPHIQIGN